MITPRTQTAIAVLKFIYAREPGTCIQTCALTSPAMPALLLQLAAARLILLKDTENPQEIQSYIPCKEASEVFLLSILEATGEHLDCNCPPTEQFYARYGRAAQKLGVVNRITRIYLSEIALADL